MRPEHVHYDYVDRWIRGSISAGEILFDPPLFHRKLQELWKEYDVPVESLISFVAKICRDHVKKTAPRVRAMMPGYLQEYKNGKSILDLAKKANYPPHLFARYIVQNVVDLPKKCLADAMRDPIAVLGSAEVIAKDYLAAEQVRSHTRQTTGVSRLAVEVMEAQESDPLHGPEHDKKRHMVGVEYEIVLEHYLRQLGVPFETENDLRGRGTARTPDVLLSSPLAIQVAKKDGSGMEWKIICWIDSKAMFGDVSTHNTTVLPQAESYVHRFGPGLVLYWFGHGPPARLADAHGDIVIASWEVPDQIMLPTGELLGKTPGLFK